MKVTLFFTYGVSLKRWAELGILTREISFYHKLMHDHGLEVLFVTYGDETDRIWENELKGIEVLPIYERLRQPKYKSLALLQSLLVPSSFRKELANSDLFKTNQIWGGWVPVIAKWLIRKPLLTRCGYDFHRFSRMRGSRNIFLLFTWVISYLTYNQADHVHVPTTTDRKSVHETFSVPTKKIEIRPNWINTDQFRPTEGPKSFQLLTVGRLHPQKNLELLFDALEGTEIAVDVIGVGPQATTLHLLAEQKNIDVTFLGQFSTSEMPSIYNRHEIYIQCSRYEGNPKTLLEAMSCGCAVIGTDVSGIREIINNEENGILVPEDPVALRNAICELMQNKRLRNHLGRTARANILEYNSMDSALDKEYKIYRKLTTSTD
tara:strand:- start:292 stop:1422 length:1131 start_codon:yes stop_codon:yes gene_type:complete